MPDARPTAANSNETVKQVHDGTRTQGSYAALVQSYSLSILAQPLIDLAKFPKLQVYQQGCNDGLATAKNQANTYIVEILPAMRQTISDLDAYFNLQIALSTVLKPGTSAKDVIARLHSIQGQVETYKSRSADVARKLTKLSTDIAGNQQSFVTFVTGMNTAVNGDNGVLASITNELKDYDSKIAGLSAGIALGGLAAIGGVLVIIAGAVGTPFTAGGSTPVIAGGIALLTIGAGAVVGSSIGLAAVLRQKSDALNRQAQLNEQVRVASGMSTAFQSFATNAGQATSASLMMANAWGFLTSDLGSLITSLESGQTDVDFIRELYVEAAKGNVATIQQDIKTIKGQLEGAERVEDANRAVADIVEEQAKRNAA